MKTVILASLVASAAAFAPASQSSTTTASSTGSALEAKPFADELGAMAPLGMFDPLGLVENGDKETFDRLRFVELKHGRISMLAVVGYLTTYAGIRFPGAEGIPSGFAAIKEVPVGVWLQVAFTIGVMEAFNRDASDVGGPTPEFVGDFRNGFIDFGWDKQSDDWKLKKRTIELNNGRAAQMGILGLMVHDVLGNVNEILP